MSTQDMFLSLAHRHERGYLNTCFFLLHMFGYQIVSDGLDPQRRTVFGEHFNYDLLEFQHKCTACRDAEGNGKASAMSR